MAEKQSTLRIKTAGLDVAATEFGQYVQKHEADVIRLNKVNSSLQSIDAKLRADPGDNAALEKRALLLERQAAAMLSMQRHTERAGIVDPARMSLNEKAFKEDLGLALTKVPGDSEAQNAVMRAAAVKWEEIQREKTAVAGQEEEKRIQNAQRASERAVEVLNQQRAKEARAVAQPSTMVEQGEAMRANMAESLRENILARAGADQAAAKDQFKKEHAAQMAQERALMFQQAQEKIRLEKATADDVQRIDSRLYAATHARQDIQLNDLRTFYAEKRALYANDAAMLQRLDQVQLIEEQKMMLARQAEQITARQPAAAVGMGLAGFGGKMIMSRAIGMAAGDILGDQRGGRELGAFAGGLMFGGPVVAAAVAGLEMIGNTYKSAAEIAKVAAKANEEYTQSLRGITEEWGNLGSSVASGDSFEKSLEGISDKARKAAHKSRDEMTDLGQESAKGYSIYEMLTGKPRENDITFEYAAHTASMEGDQNFQAKKLQGEEETKRLAAEKTILADEEAVSRAKAMNVGYTKEQAVLTAEIQLREDKLNESQRQKVATSDGAIKMLRAHIKAMEDSIPDPDLVLANGPAGRKKIQYAIADAKAELREAESARGKLTKEDAAESAHAKAEDLTARMGLQRAHDEEMHKAKVAADEADIALTENSYDREVAALRYKLADEKAELIKHGMWSLDHERQQADQLAEIDAKQHQAADMEVKQKNLETSSSAAMMAAGDDSAARLAAKHKGEVDKYLLEHGGETPTDQQRADAENVANAQDKNDAQKETYQISQQVKSLVGEILRDDDMTLATTQEQRVAVEHEYRVQKEMDALADHSRETAERIVGLEEAKVAAADKLLATKAIELDASEAQYLIEKATAKTIADRDKAKHDYEVRQETQAHPLMDPADIERMVTAKDKLEKLQEMMKPVHVGASDKYLKGYVDVKALNYGRNYAGMGGGARADVHVFARGGIVPGTGSEDSVPAMLTPGEIVLTPKQAREHKHLAGAQHFADGGEVKARREVMGYEEIKENPTAVKQREETQRWQDEQKKIRDDIQALEERTQRELRNFAPRATATPATRDVPPPEPKPFDAPKPILPTEAFQGPMPWTLHHLPAKTGVPMEVQYPKDQGEADFRPGVTGLDKSSITPEMQARWRAPVSLPHHDSLPSDFDKWKASRKPEPSSGGLKTSAHPMVAHPAAVPSQSREDAFHARWGSKVAYPGATAHNAIGPTAPVAPLVGTPAEQRANSLLDQIRAILEDIKRGHPR